MLLSSAKALRLQLAVFCGKQFLTYTRQSKCHKVALVRPWFSRQSVSISVMNVQAKNGLTVQNATLRAIRLPPTFASYKSISWCNHGFVGERNRKSRIPSQGGSRDEKSSKPKSSIVRPSEPNDDDSFKVSPAWRGSGNALRKHGAQSFGNPQSMSHDVRRSA